MQSDYLILKYTSPAGQLNLSRRPSTIDRSCRGSFHFKTCFTGHFHGRRLGQRALRLNDSWWTVFRLRSKVGRQINAASAACRDRLTMAQFFGAPIIQREPAESNAFLVAVGPCRHTRRFFRITYTGRPSALRRTTR